MLEYKIKRLLLNPNRIKYFYELDAIIEYLDIQYKFEANEDLYTAYRTLVDATGKYDLISEDDRKLVHEMVNTSEAYKKWVKEYEFKEGYRKLPNFDKALFNLNILWEKIKKYPQLYLEMATKKINNFIDYRFRIESWKESIKIQNHFYDAKIESLEQEIKALQLKIFIKKKKRSGKK
jgi:hypothetical protein